MKAILQWVMGAVIGIFIAAAFLTVVIEFADWMVEHI